MTARPAMKVLLALLLGMLPLGMLPLGTARGQAADHRPSDDATAWLSQGQTAFRQGLARMAADPRQAQEHFAQAALAFDHAWQIGPRPPALALYRARSHRLAGQLPQAILALREGLQAFPWDRDLQADLASARQAVTRPAELASSEPIASPSAWWDVRVSLSPLQAAGLALGLWWLLCLATARFSMTRSTASLGGVVLTALGLATLTGGWIWSEYQARTAPPFAVLAEDAVVRTGNGPSYPARVDTPLPAGYEVTLLGERGGWTHVRLLDGRGGWLPAETLLTPSPDPDGISR